MSEKYIQTIIMNSQIVCGKYYINRPPIMNQNISGSRVLIIREKYLYQNNFVEASIYHFVCVRDIKLR